MENEEYPSDSDQSDDDYKPDDRNSDQPSEIDSDGEPENDVAEEGAETLPKNRKRKSVGARNGSKTKRSKLNKEVEEKEPESPTESNGEEDEQISKAQSDALWADFLNGTDSAASTATSTATSSKSTSTQISKPTEETATKSKCEEKSATKQETAPAQKATVKEIFEFAGEKIEVEKEIQTDDKTGTGKGNDGPAAPASRARTSGGLSSVLGQLGKKNKLSVLEKTKLDWTGFKKNAGIEEELQVHNKGRGGYLERQDFLERTDFRRFEIEKSLRQVTRRK